MYLKHLSLQNFRNYSKPEFNLSKDITLVIGSNTSGKTNFIEAIYFLAFGKSSKMDKDENAIRFGESLARIKGQLEGNVKEEITELEVVLASGEITGGEIFRKKYMVNGVPKRRVDFMGNLFCVLFSPVDLEIIIGSPGRRRDFLDEVLSQIDREYRVAQLSFERGLRQRNALLQKVKEFGIRNEREFVYWDNLLIEAGEVITKKREEFVSFINSSTKDILDFVVFYDKSTISKERLLQYKDAEVGSGVTLVGPHRDDLMFSLLDEKRSVSWDIKLFGSRGQQRLVVLQLKLLQLLYMEKYLGFRPLLLLDDIFSELDGDHINLVLDMVGNQQTIMTTTHEEFIPKKLLEDLNVIELGKDGKRG